MGFIPISMKTNPNRMIICIFESRMRSLYVQTKSILIKVELLFGQNTCDFKIRTINNIAILVQPFNVNSINREVITSRMTNNMERERIESRIRIFKFIKTSHFSCSFLC